MCTSAVSAPWPHVDLNRFVNDFHTRYLIPSTGYLKRTHHTWYPQPGRPDFSRTKGCRPLPPPEPTAAARQPFLVARSQDQDRCWFHTLLWTLSLDFRFEGGCRHLSTIMKSDPRFSFVDMNVSFQSMNKSSIQSKLHRVIQAMRVLALRGIIRKAHSM